MTFTRIHHVSLVTGELEEARHVLSDGFGLSVDEHRTPWPENRPGDSESATTVESPIGEMFYPVSKPNEEDSDMGRFLAANNGRGECITSPFPLIASPPISSGSPTME